MMKTDSKRLPVRSRERFLVRSRERGIGIILVFAGSLSIS